MQVFLLWQKLTCVKNFINFDMLHKHFSLSYNYIIMNNT